jgi:hypothetical protein
MRLSDINKKYTFTGSNSEKNGTTENEFIFSPSISFIPSEIFAEFPNINYNLVVKYSNSKRRIVY